MLAHSVAAALAGGCIDSLAVAVVAAPVVVAVAELVVLAAVLAAGLRLAPAAPCVAH